VNFTILWKYTTILRQGRTVVVWTENSDLSQQSSNFQLLWNNITNGMDSYSNIKLNGILITEEATEYNPKIEDCNKQHANLSTIRRS